MELQIISLLGRSAFHPCGILIMIIVIGLFLRAFGHDVYELLDS
jgi:hypothetical protein